ncbi:MAG TPA: protein ndvB, partial [Candidatus Saccharimonas sp.]|nr:protein ndvB [Candidatus Saccharimonas sp.]
TGWKGPSSVRIQRLSLRNTTTKSHRLRFTAYVTWVLGTDREQWQEQVVTAWNDTDQILTATNPALSLYRTMAFMAHSEPVLDFTADRAEFWGPVRADTLPHGLAAAELSGRIGFGLDPGGVLRSEIEVPAGAEVAVEWYLGTADTPKAVASAVRALRKPSATTQALRATTGWWGDTLSALTAETPSRDTDILLNSWLLYQVLAGRIWGRTGYYQSSGAFGFRDQLQDSMALVYSRPDLTRSLIIQAAEHEFAQGDVQHWWMPGGLRGLRSRISDDRLWLPYVVSHYVNVTGDRGILGAMVPYLEEAPLAPGEPERFDAAKETRLERSLLDHCLRTIQISLTRGAHGLPLMGAGDWNDGYNLVGGAGKGESVWLGWFEVVVLRQMADLLDAIGHDPKLAKQYRSAAAGYTQALDEHAWDGEWYLRAFYDDGRTLGSARDPEDQIDSLPQSWAVIAGTGDAARRAQAVSAAVDRLVDRESKLVRLFTPAFDTSDRNPGYVKGYLPGIRENGGQYTHGSLWLTIALARLGRGDDAVELLRLMSPVNHSLDRDSANLYRLEPYVTAGDIYELPGQEGRGGWSWYTGSAAWMYRIWIEEVLGFQLRGHQLTINPCIDRNWPGFKLTYRFGKSVYTIEVTNPHGVCRGVAEQHLDGQPLPAGPVPLVDDGRPHHLEIRLGY